MIEYVNLNLVGIRCDIQQLVNGYEGTCTMGNHEYKEVSRDAHTQLSTRLSFPLQHCSARAMVLQTSCTSWPEP